MEIKLSWEQIAESAKKLAETIKMAGFKPDYLIGVTVGGLVPLGLLAGELAVRNVLTVSASSYDGKKQKEIEIKYLPSVDLSGKKVLLVDEVSETGKTLEQLSGLLKEKCHPAELRTATLVVNTKASKFRPDFYVLEVEEWVVFPGERD